ncbi:YfjI family protein [Cysteiniphilum sp. 6C5]|uniref:YfjI family protein n=1 Tax=unclassified Cysteiniphilum TaxID=2610889 RepID=UPI003F87873C
MSKMQGWKTPIPLSHISANKHEYPIDALPEIIRNAVKSYADYGQQPIALLANSALSNISLACQGLANVARDAVLVSPISMYFITVASSGERKSAADKVFGQGIEEWELETTQSLLPEYQRMKNEHTTWSIKRKGLLMMLKRMAKAGENADEQETQYDSVMLDEPEIPLLPKLKYEDITVEALSENLSKEYPNGSIWSDEAGIFLSSPTMQKDNTKFASILNRLWDGKPISIHRKTMGNIFIKDRRFTLNLMMQPLLLEQMTKKHDGINRNSGFFARTLFAYPESTMGNRYYKEPASSVNEDLERFHARIKSCLNKTLPVDQYGFGHIPTLKFSQTAKSVWVKYFDYIESAIANEYHWHSIHDLASKASENIARLSALLHIFDDQQGTEIRVNYVESAYQIIEWHLNEAKRIFGDHKETQVEHDAKVILKWIREKELVETTPKDILRSSPLRDKARRDKALKLLEKTHYIQIIPSVKGIKLYFNPCLFRVSNSSDQL